MSDLLARLIADGTSPELVAEVAMLLAEKQLAQRSIEERRAKDRERQNRRRHVMSRDITLDDVTERDPSLPRPLSPQTPLTPTPTHPDNNTRARKGSGLDRPADVSETVWRDALSHRKALKKPLTETALLGIRREADKAGWPIEAALVEMVSRGWQGFKSDWVEAAAKPSTSPAAPIDPVAAAERTAALYRRMGRDDDAKAEEERAARLRSGSGPPRSIDQIVAGLNAPPH